MKVLKNSLHLLLIVCLLVPMLLVPAGAAEAPIYLALGDSISTGYGLPEGTSSFVEQLADCYPDFTLVNEAVNGFTPADVYEQIKDGSLDDEIANAKLITLTCGGNDLIGTLYGKITTLYNAEHPTTPIDSSDLVSIFAGTHPTVGLQSLVPYAVKAIDKFSQSDEFKYSLTEFTFALDNVMDYLRKINPTAIVVIPTQYNPYKSFASGDFVCRIIYREVEAGIQKLNNVIKSQSEIWGFACPDVYTAFTASAEDLCNSNEATFDLDFHPNTAGHTVIKDTILAMNLIPSFGYHKDTVSLSGGTIDVSVTALEGCANLVAAFYDAKGRMMGCDMEPVTDSNLQVTLSAKFSGTADHVRIFLLDSVTLAPIYDALTYPAK